MFLLLTAILIVVLLFHQGLRHTSRANQLTAAVRLAENKMAEIRKWAQDPANFASAWTPYKNVTSRDPEAPSFFLHIDCQPTGLATDTPCSALEALHDPDRRTLNVSVVPVRVRVSWHPTDSARSVSLLSYVAAPVREVARLQVDRTGGDPDPVPPEGEVGFKATLFDPSGTPIPEVMFAWSVEAISGNATIDKSPPRDGSTAKLKHHYRFNPVIGTWTYVEGEVRVRARARYHGLEYTGTSEKVVLSP
jgi:hypothetical protein